MSKRTFSLGWIGRRRVNNVGPLGESDFVWFRGIGIVLFAISLIVTAIYGSSFDVAAYTTFRGELRTARGTVTVVEPTGGHEPDGNYRRRDERTEIVAVSYAFIDAGGIERQGVSYRPGSRLKVGATVTVEHPVGRPEVSRIRGYRTAWYDSMPWALAIMAGVGVAFLIAGIVGPRVWRKDSGD